MTRPATAPRLGGPFWGLWSSSSLSNLADGLFKVALPLIALEVTRSPLVVAGVTAALTVPWLVLALPVGALVDRFDRRRVMVAANGARAAVLGALAFLALADAATIPALYVAALAAGVAEVWYDTAAQTILPQVVDRAHLTRANGRLIAAELTANEFIGPPLGGLLVTIGAALALAVPAGLWCAALGLLLLLRGSFRVPREATARTTIRADVAEGLRFLWRDGLLRLLTVATGVFNLASSAVVAVFVVFAVGTTSALGLTATQYGVLLTTVAAGSVAGTFVAAAVERRLGSAWALTVGLVAGAAFLGVPAVSTEPVVIAAGFALGGAGVVVWNVIAVSLRQRVTPDAVLGRVTGAHRLVGWGTKPLGAALGGVLGQVVGLQAVFVTAAVAVLALAAVVLPVSTRAIRSRGPDDGDAGRTV